MLRITHYLPTVRLEDGGVPRAVLDLCGTLPLHGVNMTLATFDATDVPKDWVEGKVERLTIDVQEDGLPRGGILARKHLLRLEQHLRASDVLHLHGPWNPGNLQLASRARKLGVPYVVTAHGMLDDWSMRQKSLKKRVFLHLGARSFLENAAMLHCTANAEAEQAKHWCKGQNIVVLYYLFDGLQYAVDTSITADLARQAYPEIKGPEPKLLFLSRLHPKKRLELLIDACRLLKERDVPFRLLIAGTGDPAYEVALQRRVLVGNLAGNVSFLGMVKGDLKISLYRASNLFILPTYQENFGLVFAEALACELPVITTKGVDIWQDLQEAGAEVLEHDTPEELADVIAEMLADREALERIGREGKLWIQDALASGDIADEYCRLYAKLAGKVWPE